LVNVVGAIRSLAAGAALALLVAAPVTAQAAWVDEPAPAAGCLAAHPTRAGALVAFADHQAARRDPITGTWTPIGAAGSYLADVAYGAGDDLWALHDEELWRSGDGGAFWSAVWADTSHSAMMACSPRFAISGVAADVERGTAYVAAPNVDDPGIVRVADGVGTQWNAGLPTPRAAYDVAVDPHDGAVYALVPDGVWRRAPLDAEWTHVGATPGATRLEADASTAPATIWAWHDDPGALWRSTDAGETWSSVDLPGGNGAVGQVAVGGGRVAVLEIGVWMYEWTVVWLSTDGGSTWSALAEPDDLYPAWTSSVAVDAQDLWIVAGGAVRRWVGTIPQPGAPVALRAAWNWLSGSWTAAMRVPETVEIGFWLNDPHEFDYAWLRCDAAGGACVPVATGETYVPVLADAGRTLRIQITGRSGPHATTVTSPPSFPVQGAPPLGDAPPAIGGSARAGQTLAAIPGRWVDAAEVEREWELCVGGACTTAPAGASLLLTDAHVGATVRLAETAISPYGVFVARSAAVGPVAAAPPATPAPSAPTPEPPPPPAETSPPPPPREQVVASRPRALRLPTVTGRPRAGAVLRCRTGAWAGRPTRLAITWLRNGRLRAAGPAYRVRAADKGARLACRVRASNAGGTGASTSRAVTVPRARR
jgi:hypothetical protein